MSLLPVYIDFKSPAAWLAFKPLTELAKRQSVQIEWRPFRSKSEEITEPTANESKGARHRRIRAIARRRIALKYAAIQGIPMHFPATPCTTNVALASLLTLRQQDRTNYIRKLFLAFWSQHLDLSDPEIIERCRLDAGLTNDEGIAWPATTALAALETHQQEALAAGIIDAPTILADNQLFIGREHLPWIESYLNATSSNH